MTFRIRDVQPEDFGELFALDQACYAPGIAWSKAELGFFLRYPGNISLAVQDEQGGIAGFAIAGIRRKRGSTAGHLITIDVRAECRRRGVGHALMEAVDERLRAAGAEKVQLEVAMDNTVAQEFYLRHGFVRTGRIPGYYLGRIDALVMEKPL